MSTLMRPDPTIQRSSLFDLAAHSKHLPYGKSNLSFAIEPHPDDEPPRQRQASLEKFLFKDLFKIYFFII